MRPPDQQPEEHDTAGEDAQRVGTDVSGLHATDGARQQRHAAADVVDDPVDP